MDPSRNDLYSVLIKIRDLRAWAVENKVNSWALRQGLILALTIDERVAMKHGVTPQNLIIFDEGARLEAFKWCTTEGL